MLALALALVNSVLPVWGSIARDQRLMAVAPPVALMGFGLVAYAYFALTMAHVVSDFSLVNVVENSHSAKPLIYKITGVWGNHEGSMLLWVLVLSLFAAAVALFSRSMPEDMRANVLAVQSWIAAAFGPVRCRPISAEEGRDLVSGAEFGEWRGSLQCGSCLGGASIAKI
jgi:cytochrome c-type biogenesis protein CcmF